MTANTRIPITELLAKYEDSLIEIGYSYTTRLLFLKQADFIIRRHEVKGLEYIAASVIEEYICEINHRYLEGKLQKRHYDRTMREIERFAAFADSGQKPVAPPSPLKGTRQKLSPEFGQLADNFVAGEFHPNTRCDVRWAVYKYFSWLENQGFSNLEGVGAPHLQRFLLDCSKRYSPSAVHNIRLYLKKLYAYLHVAGMAESDFSELLSFTVNRERKVFPSLSKAEIAKLLDAIDRTSIKGRRDYAIMMLGTVLGLRACDIVSLKLSDIDWINGEIRVIQSKTSVPVVLPLTQDVGTSLSDYILNARPRTEAKEIFLRINAPHTALKAAVTIGEIYRDCCRAAGIKTSKRFHNLRRSLGTSMVSNGVSVYDVAQVFGDRNVESTKPYLAADTAHLKMCALTFEGIAPMEGTMR